MKKSVIALTVFFVLQAVLLCLFAMPEKEPVKWDLNAYGEYEIAGCEYSDKVFDEINAEISEYIQNQKETYLTDPETQIVVVKESRILENSDKNTIVEYTTIRKNYTSVEEGKELGSEVLETAHLCIVETDGGVSVNFQKCDCKTKAFTNNINS